MVPEKSLWEKNEIYIEFKSFCYHGCSCYGLMGRNSYQNLGEL